MIIRVDTHTHTIASDHAYSTLQENAAGAAKVGIEAFGMTDHTAPLNDAPHSMHFMNLLVIDREIEGVYVFRGAELNICDEHGDIHLKDTVLSQLDYCIASIHPIVFASYRASENLSAYIGAMKNPWVKIIGHPEDGRVPVDFDELARAARDTGTLIEVNNSSLRPISYRTNTRENMKRLLEACERHGAMVSLGSDAHFSTAVGRFDEALGLFSEVGFPEKLVACTSLEAFRAVIAKKA